MLICPIRICSEHLHIYLNNGSFCANGNGATRKPLFNSASVQQWQTLLNGSTDRSSLGLIALITYLHFAMASVKDGFLLAYSLTDDVHYTAKCGISMV